MLSILTIIFPIFALVLCGWLARKKQLLGEAATEQLNKYVVYLALPALLFDIVANASVATLWQPDFILCFTASTFILFVLTTIRGILSKKPLADTSIDGLNTSYANTGFMGFPLLFSIAGEQSLTLALIASIVTVCILFAAAIVLMEVGLQQHRRKHQIILPVIFRVIKNPLVASPLIATVFPLTGLHLPSFFNHFLQLLGDSAAPCALVTLGLFLAGRKAGQSVFNRTTVSFVSAKLLIHPAITLALASYVFSLPPLALFGAVLLAALPTGTGPFMLAEHYQREAGITSDTVLLSTLGSVVTLPLIMFWLQPV